MKKGFVLCFLTTTLLANGFFVGKKAFLLNGVYQLALLYYEAGREVLIISATYQGKNTDFIWVIPVRSRPRVSKAPRDIFVKFSELLSCPKFDIRYAPVNMPNPVLVLRQRPLMGDQSATPYEEIYPFVDFQFLQIFSPPSPSAFLNWCKEEGYYLPSTAKELLKKSMEEGWYLLVLKIKGSAERRKLFLWTNITPVKLEFQTKEIIYPTRLSILNRYAGSLQLGRYEKWLGKEYKEMDSFTITNRVVEITKKDIKSKKPFSRSLLNRLGYDYWEHEYNGVLKGEIKLGEFIEDVIAGVYSDLQFFAALEKTMLWLATISPYPLIVSRGWERFTYPIMPIYILGIDRDLITSILDEGGNTIFSPGEGKLYITVYDFPQIEFSSLSDFVFERSSVGKIPQIARFLGQSMVPESQKIREKEKLLTSIVFVTKGILLYPLLVFFASPFGLIFLIVTVLYKIFPTRTNKILSLLFQTLTFLWFLGFGITCLIMQATGGWENDISNIDLFQEVFDYQIDPIPYLFGALQIAFSAIVLYVILRQHKRKLVLRDQLPKPK